MHNVEIRLHNLMHVQHIDVSETLQPVVLRGSSCDEMKRELEAVTNPLHDEKQIGILLIYVSSVSSS